MTRRLLVALGAVLVLVLAVVALVVPVLGPVALAVCATGTGSAVTAEVVLHHVHR